jgi:hypothetical protein
MKIKTLFLLLTIAVKATSILQLKLAAARMAADSKSTSEHDPTNYTFN